MEVRRVLVRFYNSAGGKLRRVRSNVRKSARNPARYNK
jgi:hypothetical protein